MNGFWLGDTSGERNLSTPSANAADDEWLLQTIVHEHRFRSSLLGPMFLEALFESADSSWRDINIVE
jgi:hypothetical protein